MSATLKLKEFRKSAVPRLTVRKIAEELGMPFGTYSFYESPSTYKKPHLPLDFTRKVAAVLSRYGVDPAEVMKLAGLVDEEAAPEARVIEESRAQPVQLLLPVTLPSVETLTAMFEGLLALVPPSASRSECAQILAEHLPSGFVGAGFSQYIPVTAASPARDVDPRAAARETQ